MVGPNPGTRLGHNQLMIPGQKGLQVHLFPKDLLGEIIQIFSPFLQQKLSCVYISHSKHVSMGGYY